MIHVNKSAGVVRVFPLLNGSCLYSSAVQTFTYPCHRNSNLGTRLLQSREISLRVCDIREAWISNVHALSPEKSNVPCPMRTLNSVIEVQA